jgi:hypothetical protein
LYVNIGKLRLPPLVATLLLVALAVAAFSVSPAVERASAYVTANGCDEYDPQRAIYYQCTPDRSTFYTPDGVNPSAVAQGTGYPGETSTYTTPINKFGGTLNIYDGGAIPPPAPYVQGRDYCSNPWFGNSVYEGRWQFTCYRHDVCYGSQLGRKYCDVHFWRNMVSDCKAFGWYNPDRYACFVDARVWYYAARWFGASHYKARLTSLEPAGS